MQSRFRPFSVDIIKEDLLRLKDREFRFLRCRDYLQAKNSGEKIAILRIDIDAEPNNLDLLEDILISSGIKASFFIRIHGPYNPLSHSLFDKFQRLIQQGHEVGLHSEIMDFCEITGDEPLSRMKEDVNLLKAMFNLDSIGVSSHGDFSGLNNLDFWKHFSPDEVGVLYESYDTTHLNLFKNSTYLSDSEWLHWKKYECGELSPERFSRLPDAIMPDTKRLYILLHPETLYSRNPFENQ